MRSNAEMIDRILRALRTRPTWRDALETLIAIAVFASIAAAVSATTGLAHWSPVTCGQLATIFARAFFIPALGEEILFRAMLVPAKGESQRPIAWIAGSTLLFVVWHIVETTFLPGATVTFLRVDFLFLAGLLGLLCAVLRYRSGSIWTAVALHWLVVVMWQGWMGGVSALGGL